MWQIEYSARLAVGSQLVQLLALHAYRGSRTTTTTITTSSGSSSSRGLGTKTSSAVNAVL